jgi:hypothetical protein
LGTNIIKILVPYFTNKLMCLTLRFLKAGCK